MATYVLLCCNAACLKRRVSRIHPADYVLIVPCQACGQRAGWQVAPREPSKPHACRCEGPLGRNGRPYPHRSTHPLCGQHPQGPAHQARRAGMQEAEAPARVEFTLRAHRR
ncbi:MAG: hypothetical protein V4723_07290 [Pseudomonadota bacterium]